MPRGVPKARVRLLICGAKGNRWSTLGRYDAVEEAVNFAHKCLSCPWLVVGTDNLPVAYGDGGGTVHDWNT